MSQFLNHKAVEQAERGVPKTDNASKTQLLTKAKKAENSQSRSVNPKEPRKSRSKNKIPKSVRYDLESALVGLCDAWFVDIKPHLVRNNIKLHVHKTKADADAACASGDFDQPRTDAPPCTHLDPGAAPDLLRQKNAIYVDSCAMPSTVSEAHCIKPPTSITRQYQTPRVKQSSPYDHLQNCQQNSEPVPFRKKRKPRSQQVSRLCQTYNIFPASIIEPTPPIRDVHIRNLFKSIFNKVPICPASSPRKYLAKSTERIVSVASKTESSNAEMHCQSRAKAEAQTITWQKLWRDPPNLFPNDLIDIIGKRNDTILRNTCKSHEKVPLYPSMIELVSPIDRKKPDGPKKNPPWR